MCPRPERMLRREVDVTKRSVRRLVIAVLLAVSFLVAAGTPADARMCTRVRMIEPFSDIEFCTS